MIFFGIRHQGPCLERWAPAESAEVFIATASACPLACNPTQEHWGLPRISGQNTRLVLTKIRPLVLQVGNSHRSLRPPQKSIVQSLPSDPGVWVPKPLLDLPACRTH